MSQLLTIQNNMCFCPLCGKWSFVITWVVGWDFPTFGSSPSWKFHHSPAEKESLVANGFVLDKGMDAFDWKAGDVPRDSVVKQQYQKGPSNGGCGDVQMGGRSHVNIQKYKACNIHSKNIT